MNKRNVKVGDYSAHLTRGLETDGRICSMQRFEIVKMMANNFDRQTIQETDDYRTETERRMPVGL